jgi:TonB family protein
MATRNFEFDRPIRPEFPLWAVQRVQPPLWRSLWDNTRYALFPRKLPPLKLTSRPIPVTDVWGRSSYSKTGAMGSLFVHALALSVIVAATFATKSVVQAEKPREIVHLIAPSEADLAPLPVSKQPISGGGGGGDRDRLKAPKGRLPRQSLQQIVPPQLVVRNEAPKLTAEPTVVMPPQVQMASNKVPNLGDPSAAALPSGPPSNGTGSGGGIGSGSGGGVGVGEGPGVGAGRGGGIGGGVYHVGGGVSAPRPIATPDPEYTEAARQAKYQGTCVLWLIVGANGVPRDVRISRSLGLGLDEKAIDAVRQWRFEPALKDGKPVAVKISVEVSFKLY